MTFVLDPNAVATGHNPDKFTQAQVGTAEGWRLLEENEKGPGFKMLTELEIFRFGRWVSDQCGDCPKQTYRTKLTKSQLAEKRGLNPSPGSAATAPDATPEPSSADDAREHAGAPVETPDELLRALNELQRHLGISFLIRCLAELSTPIHVEWTGQAFRRPNQKEVKPCANQNDSANGPSGQASAQSTEQPKSSLASNAAESSPTPDSGGNAADIIRWVIESLLSISENMDADQVGRIDIAMEQLSYALRMMKRIPNSVGNPYNGPFSTTHQNLAWQKAQDSGGNEEEVRACQEITEALHKAGAAAREECTKLLAQKDEGYVLLAGDREKALAEVERLKSRCNELLSIGEKNLALERDVAAWSVTASNHESARNAAYDINEELRAQLAATLNDFVELTKEKQAHEHTKNCCDGFQLSLQAERSAHEQTKAMLRAVLNGQVGSLTAQEYLERIAKP